ncbi:transposase [Streptomyces sp. NPDC001093]|uniref:transposase n=1 Tax=Streptomyces sp. NPDC001093 TaxID=3154376 RepID=UPI003322A45D
MVPREDKSDRRINVLGALVVGADPDLCWEHTPCKIDAAVLLEFVCCRLAGLPGGAAALAPAADGGGPALPVWRRPRPCTVVLDNASAHLDKEFKGCREQLARIGVELFYLPPRSPELNDIERIWRSAKYEDYPHRAHTSIDAIAPAMDQALTRQRTRIKDQQQTSPEPLSGRARAPRRARRAGLALPMWLLQVTRTQARRSGRLRGPGTRASVVTKVLLCRLS